MEQTPFDYWRSLGLSVRAANGLVSAGITSIAAAQSVDDKTLYQEAHHIGKQSLQQIRAIAPHTPQPSVIDPGTAPRRRYQPVGGVPLVCSRCGNPFMGKTRRATLCSRRCKDAKGNQARKRNLFTSQPRL